MRLKKSEVRGFKRLSMKIYGEVLIDSRIVQESSDVDSALWIGEHHLLPKEDVKEFVEILNLWLKTGELDYIEE